MRFSGDRNAQEPAGFWGHSNTMKRLGLLLAALIACSPAHAQRGAGQAITVPGAVNLPGGVITAPSLNEGGVNLELPDFSADLDLSLGGVPNLGLQNAAAAPQAGLARTLPGALPGALPAAEVKRDQGAPFAERFQQLERGVSGDLRGLRTAGQGGERGVGAALQDKLENVVSAPVDGVLAANPGIAASRWGGLFGGGGRREVALTSPKTLPAQAAANLEAAKRLVVEVLRGPRAGEDLSFLADYIEGAIPNRGPPKIRFENRVGEINEHFRNHPAEDDDGDATALYVQADHAVLYHRTASNLTPEELAPILAHEYFHAYEAFDNSLEQEVRAFKIQAAVAKAVWARAGKDIDRAKVPAVYLRVEGARRWLEVDGAFAGDSAQEVHRKYFERKIINEYREVAGGSVETFVDRLYGGAVPAFEPLRRRIASYLDSLRLILEEVGDYSLLQRVRDADAAVTIAVLKEFGWNLDVDPEKTAPKSFYDLLSTQVVPQIAAKLGFLEVATRRELRQPANYETAPRQAEGGGLSANRDAAALATFDDAIARAAALHGVEEEELRGAISALNREVGTPLRVLTGTPREMYRFLTTNEAFVRNHVQARAAARRAGSGVVDLAPAFSRIADDADPRAAARAGLMRTLEGLFQGDAAAQELAAAGRTTAVEDRLRELLERTSILTLRRGLPETMAGRVLKRALNAMERKTTQEIYAVSEGRDEGASVAMSREAALEMSIEERSRDGVFLYVQFGGAAPRTVGVGRFPDVTALDGRPVATYYLTLHQGTFKLSKYPGPKQAPTTEEHRRALAAWLSAALPEGSEIL